ncbi:hypothetical protein FE257_009618 [Aspergillus nanangensis]|uniref:tRNA (guanine(10)-N(2))-methyltransferase n=1 Tax=Aspergillus nanangensis TaxID=2582783 RepID=A0AAD4CK80_ASPNN|nr:hypothetical protein FE257_009618 [Aspergillus nanangensis]
MEYLIRFAQTHETFRRPELEALASLQGIDLEILFYDRFSPYCIVKLQSEQDARSLVSRSILAKDIVELWGQGTTYEELHADVRRRTHHRWADYLKTSFRFTVESFGGRRTMEAKRDIIQSFSYVAFEGPIDLKNPDEDFWVMEEYLSPQELAAKSTNGTGPAPPNEPRAPLKIYLGRWVGNSSRDVINKYDLKKRGYISTTSMDAELTLITANMAHAAPGKFFYDPFVGTGSFCVAAAHFGAATFGSDIDGRSFRGKDRKPDEPIGLLANFQQYGIADRYMDAFTSDLTNSPLRPCQLLDGIVCDPPYGVREGLRVLGMRDGRAKPEVIIDGVPSHLRPDYIAPKKPYGFEAMLNDILAFACQTLVTHGRLAMWMPTSNDEDVDLLIPMHPNLQVISVSVQPFSNWSRRLIVYRRLPEGETSDISLARRKADAEGVNADELNAFRKKRDAITLLRIKRGGLSWRPRPTSLSRLHKGKMPSLTHEENFVGSKDPSQAQAATDQHGRALFQFDKAAERRLRWKMDLYILPTVSLLYLFCFIDRANIGNAKLAGFDKDLGLTGYGYNHVLSVFYISYIIFEIPGSLCCKWMGPGWFIPLSALLFGVSSVATAFVNTIHQASGVRFLLGVAEAGMMPGIAYYLSRWYRRSELAFRLSTYIVMAPLAGAFGGLLASGILKLDHFGSLHTWRMLFAVEGIITIGLAIISFCTLTDRPETARWLSQGEKDLAIARLKSERVATTVLLDKIDTKKLLRGIFSPVTLATSLIFLLDNITVGGLAFFAPTIVKTIYPDSSVIHQQLLTVPPYIVGAFFTLLLPFLSWQFDRRMPFFVAGPPLMMAGYIMFLTSTDAKVRYGATFLIASGAFAFGALCNAHVSNNVISDTARSAAIGTNVMIGHIGGLISTWSFLEFDAPNYPIGNGLNLATSSTCLILSGLLWVWMHRDNRKRERTDIDNALSGLSVSQIQDLDWRNPAFKWRP